MDAPRFDAMTRLLSGPGSRRRLLGAAMGSLIGAGLVSGVAKKKKVALCLNGQPLSVAKKAKKKYLAQGATLGACPASPSPPPPPPEGCPGGQKPCQGRCIPSNQCCVDADCAALAPRCCQGTCIRAAECCTTSDCGGGKICQGGGCACPTTNIECGGACCIRPPGLPVTGIRCGARPGPVCLCAVQTTDICAAGCTEVRVFDLTCDSPEVDLFPLLCEEVGCDPPAQ